jgi:2-hydroxychromene-2-carboxylate isomerase
MRATFRFDTNSPYAYLAAARVDELLGPDVDWQPIAFAFLLRAQDRRPWSFDEPTRSDGKDICERRALAYGLPPLVWPPGWPIDSYGLEPLRALTAARAHGRVRDLALLLFARNFVIGDGLQGPGTVRDCWVQAGLDGAGYDAELAAAKQPLIDVTQAAIDEGVPGVPTVTIDGFHFWGDDRLPAAAAALSAA